MSLAYILLGVLVGTGLILLFIRLGQFRLWKVMYFLAIFLASSITLGVFVGAWVAYIAALVLAVLEIYRSSMLIHNLTELLIYPGIAILLVPLLTIEWVILLLVFISAYDIFAVWKSKHMVKMAKFQTRSRSFAGFVIPYGRKGIMGSIRGRMPKGIGGKGKGGVRAAILGGGDIAFPLLFAGVVMDWLIVTVGVSKTVALFEAYLISVISAIALFALFVKAEKDKFYPAMPFITAGCLLGLGLVWMINFFI